MSTLAGAGPSCRVRLHWAFGQLDDSEPRRRIVHPLRPVLERAMINNDLEIRLVRLERQTSLLTRLVVSAISIAVAVVAQMLVEQYVGSRFWGLCTLAAMLVFSNWLLYREVRLIEEPFIRMVEQDNAAHAAAPAKRKKVAMARR
jgi:hypothetical protein